MIIPELKIGELRSCMSMGDGSKQVFRSLCVLMWMDDNIRGTMANEPMCTVDEQANKRFTLANIDGSVRTTMNG